MEFYTQKEWREGDIVNWFYTSEELERLNHRRNNGTTYWCCSQIAIFKNGRFFDTYWYSENKSFTIDQINDRIFVKFIANFDELEKISDQYTIIDDLEKYYDRSDIINLNHPNSPRGNLYIRKGAKKKIDIMRESYKFKIKNIEDKINSLQYNLDKTKKEFENLSEDNFTEYKNWL